MILIEGFVSVCNSHIFLPIQVTLYFDNSLLLIVIFKFHKTADQIVKKIAVCFAIFIYFAEVAVRLFFQQLIFFEFPWRQPSFSFKLRVRVFLLVNIS